MKELLKHYKDVKEKADPTLAVYNDIAEEDLFDMMVDLQKEVLEIEQLLYSYWERNVMVSGDWYKQTPDSELKKQFTIAQARLTNPNKFRWFYNWLNEQLIAEIL